MEKIPAELRKTLFATPKAKAVWDGLTPIARRDFISWIESAKQEETRKRRIESIPSRLASGKRRPCCYALVPMNLYKVLSANPKAKARWKDLSPAKRRDFAQWVNAAKDAQARDVRITKVCETLVLLKNK